MNALPEPLGAALRAADAEAVAAWFAASTAADRRAVEPAVRAHDLAMEEVDWIPDPRSRAPPAERAPSGSRTTTGREDLRAILASVIRWNRHVETRHHEVAWMASFGVARPSDRGTRRLPTASDAVLLGRALGRRWVRDVVTRLFAQRPLQFNGSTFHVLRAWVRAALLDVPDNPAYYHAMVRMAVEPGMTRADTLRADPDLLEGEFWHLFSPQGQGECSLSACDRVLRPEGTWHAGVIELASTGEIDRTRLLDACIDALTCDFEQGRAGWYSRVHDALKPTPAELVTRKQRYLRLLGSRIGPTVALAVRSLKRLRKQRVVSADELLDHALPALRSRAKQSVIGTLALIDATAKHDAARAPDLARLACEALTHEKADVQDAALVLVERYGEPADDALRTTIARIAPGVATSLHERLGPWMGSSSGSDGGPALPRAPVPFDVLADDRRIAPIEDVPELVAVLASVLESMHHMDERERVLDGIARLGPTARAEHAELLQPLAKRLRPLTKRPASEWHVVWWETARIAYALATGDDLGRFPLAFYQARYYAFASARADALVDHLLAGDSVQLLSTPTHAGCWLDPRDLVLRAIEDDAADDLPDQALALLRLAPGHRELALEAAYGLDDTEFTAALRHALGSDEERIGPTAALWYAAARARAPGEIDAKVARKHGRDIPDGGMPARHTFTWDVGDREQRAIEPWLVAQVDPAPARDQTDAELLPLIHARHQESVRADHGGIESLWFLALAPNVPDAALAHGVTAIASFLDRPNGAWGGAQSLQALLEPWLPLEGLAVTLLVFGLATRGPEQRALAVDAALRAIESGRLQADVLGTELGHWLPQGFVKPPRWATTLGEVARTSPAHAGFVQRAVELALRGDPADAPRGMVSLYELLIELTATTGEPVSDPDARAYLAGVTSTGKTRKAVRTLLRD